MDLSIPPVTPPSNGLIDELKYRQFAYHAARDPSVTAERYCLHFGGDAAAFAARFERERNAGARIADDFFCKGCGARGWRGFCPACTSAA